MSTSYVLLAISRREVEEEKTGGRQWRCNICESRDTNEVRRDVGRRMLKG